MAKAWQQHITREDGSLDMGAYVFFTRDALRTALRRRDVFVSPSWRYADPRIGLLDGAEGRSELSLGALDKLEEPNSLLQLRAAVADLNVMRGPITW